MSRETEIIDLQWEYAQRFVMKLGPFPLAITSCIRRLSLIQGAKNYNIMREMTRDAVLDWVEKSPTLKATLYHALTDIYPSKLQNAQNLSVDDLLGYFTSEDIMRLMALVYLYRRIQRKADKAEWERIKINILTHIDIGRMVGENVKELDPIQGAFLAGMRVLSSSIFLLSDVKGFKEYRRKLDSKDQIVNENEEEKRWGCSHRQIATLLLQGLGFGVNYALLLGRPPEQKLSDKHAIHCVRTLNWIESIHKKGSNPADDEMLETMFKDRETWINLKKRCQEVVKSEAPIRWLDRGKIDVPDEFRESLGIKIREVSTEEVEEIGEEAPLA